MSPPQPSATWWRSPIGRSRLLLFAVVLGFYLSSPNVTNTDAYLAVPTAVSIVHSRNLDLDEFSSPLVRGHYDYIAVNGRHYDRAPWADALFFVPGVIVVDGLHWFGIGRDATALVETNRMGPLQLLTASLVTALVAVVVAVLAFDRLRGTVVLRRRTAFFVGLVFALGTSAWSTASRSLWQHGPSMLALSLALLAATRLEERVRPAAMAAALGATLAAAYALRPTNAIAIVGFSVLVGVRHRRWTFWYLAGHSAVLGGFAGVNLWAFGRVLPEYFAASRISLHPAFLEAVAANLFSPARGILVFSPIVVLSVAGLVIAVRRRSLAPLDVVAAGCVGAQLLVVSAQNEGWWAGHAFGPRFLCDVLPLLAYLSLPAVQALQDGTRTPRPTGWAKVGVGAVGLAVALSVAINAEGAYLRASTCWNVDTVDVDLDPSRVWDLRHPQVLAGFKALATESARRAVLGPCKSTATTLVDQ